MAKKGNVRDIECVVRVENELRLCTNLCPFRC